jgi:hypothetical protein
LCGVSTASVLVFVLLHESSVNGGNYRVLSILSLHFNTTLPIEGLQRT